MKRFTTLQKYKNVSKVDQYQIIVMFNGIKLNGERVQEVLEERVQCILFIAYQNQADRVYVDHEKLLQ